jgi:hypothetical protein
VILCIISIYGGTEGDRIDLSADFIAEGRGKKEEGRGKREEGESGGVGEGKF